MNIQSEDRLIGITPILIRRAAYYITLGEGIYYPDHPHFNKVIVEKLYDIMQNPLDSTEWALGLKVGFYQDNHLVRWIEFSCRLTGAGGDPVLRKV